MLQKQGNKIMEIATSELIRKIDNVAEISLGIPTVELMRRAGCAVADTVKKTIKDGKRVVILAGGGNNGGDGYAAALVLYSSYDTVVIDLFSKGQRSDAGKYFLAECEKLGIVTRGMDKAHLEIQKCDIVVDAVFGIGYTGELSTELRDLSRAIATLGKKVVAVDIPLGVSADTAVADEHSLRADATACLCRLKPAHISYPALEYMGNIYLSDLGLSEEIEELPKSNEYIAADFEFAKKNLPKREALSNKGTYGHTLHITGSQKYIGAAMLSIEASLRTGVGLLTHMGTENVRGELRARFPEVIYTDISEKSPVDIIEYSKKFSSILIGCGSGVGEELFLIIKALITSEGAPLIIDADGINSIAEFSSPELFKSARRTVVITPHPRELSRLSGKSTEYINSNRIPFSEKFAAQYGVILLLKGAATVITDGKHTVINTSGSSALAKGGSGDVLSGIISSLMINAPSYLSAVALAAYLHGRAADTLAEQLSEFGVTPSDLPIAVAREIKKLLN